MKSILFTTLQSMSLPMTTVMFHPGIIRWSGGARHTHRLADRKSTAILLGNPGYPIASFKTGWQSLFKVKR
jgi:hypothetical protein